MLLSVPLAWFCVLSLVRCVLRTSVLECSTISSNFSSRCQCVAFDGPKMQHKNLVQSTVIIMDFV